MPVYTSVDGVIRKIKEKYTSVDGVIRSIKETYTSVDGVIRKTFSSFKETLKWYAGCTLSGSWFGGCHYATYGWTNNDGGIQNPTSLTSYCNFTSDYIYLRQSSAKFRDRGACCFNFTFTKDTKYLHITSNSSTIGLLVELYSSWSNAMDYHIGSNVSGQSNFTPPNEAFEVSGTDIWIDVNVDGRNTGKTLWVMLTAYSSSNVNSTIQVTSIGFTNTRK